MKKRIFSTLLALCMLLCLMPTAAFAEESTETPPVCSCETACTTESMNTDCPVCGAEGALPENCARYARPADNAAAQPEKEVSDPQPEKEVSDPQPEGKVSDPQPETALTALSGEGETPAASGAVTDVSTAADLTAAIANPDVNTVRLAANIDISNTLTVNRTVTLDLNGYALTVGGTELDIFSVDENGNLTVKDSGTGGKIDGQNKNCGFWIYGGVLTLESGTITNCTTDGDGGAVDISSGDSEGVYGKFVMNGGAITNCKVSDDSGAVDIGNGCTFIMNSGTISGCRADDDAGAIFIKRNASFVMNGGTIENCSAGFCGGAVKIRNTSSFTMTGGTISNCTAQQGGGVYVDDSSTFNMNGGSIANCTAVNGGNSVFVMSGTGGKFTMTDGTVDGSVTLHYTVAGSDVYMDGLGTAAYPYQIGTAAQLKLFRDIVNGAGDQTPNCGACAVLTNDIVLNDGTFDANGNYITTGLIGANPEEWTPIGKYTDDGNNTPYTGTFDGKHYAIKGLYVVNLPDVAVGLFGGLKGAAVRNLTVDGYVQGCDFVSGIAGDAKANSTIENCRNDCHVVSEYGADSGSFLYVGGIVGSAADTTIAGCVNTGVVEARGSNNFGSVAAGIVGILYGNATVINCYNTGEINVTGDKLREGTAGGIAGKDIDAHNTVSDCYNVGAVTVEYTGNSDSYIAMVGGVMGKIFYFDTTVSNCYSVGTLKSTTGKGTSYIGGVVGITDGTVGNCYYLDSTATKAVGNDDGTVDEATGPKTAAQLGDGTVLTLLINNRADSDHPWNRQCQYLAAAGKTLPVFKTQTGDAHTHDWSAWTPNGDGTHSRRCTCNVVETQNCSGGKATCTQEAKCTVCGAEYGNALGHDFTTSWTHDDNEHWKQCSRCDAKDDVGPHTWDNGTITTAPTCTKAGERTYTCPECGATKMEPIDATGHSWKSDWTSDATHHWHECTNKNCDMTDNSGKSGYAEHTGGKATCTEKAKCTVCGVKYGAIDSANHTGTEQWTQTATTHEKKWSCCGTVNIPSENHEWADGVCSECGYVCLHDDTDKNHICDICGKTISEHADTDKNHICDYCNKKISDHSGGTATCIAKAVCEICKESYGSLDPNNHTDLKHIDAKAATAAEKGNIEYWHCGDCNKYFSDAAAKTEITKAATLTAKLPPKITAGDGAAVTQGEKKELTFTSDASFADFVRVELDGTTLEEKNYTKREGSTIITLNRDFVAALSAGEHTLAIVSQHGTATAKFTVNAKPVETATPQPTVTPQPTAQPTQTAQPQPTVQPVSPIPRTGDTANPALWFALLIVSGSALAAIFVLRRKDNRK